MNTKQKFSDVMYDLGGQIPYSLLAADVEVCCICKPNQGINNGEKIRYKTPHLIKHGDDDFEVAVGYVKCPNCGAHITFGLSINMDD